MKNQPNVLVKRIKRKIIKEIRDISRGFEVVWEEQDGCDNDGPMFWVECRNRFSGRSWDIGTNLRYKILEYLQRIAKEGIEYNHNLYFLDPKIYFVEFGNYDSFVKPDFKIKLVTNDEHNKISPFLKHIPLIYNKIKENMTHLQNNRIKHGEAYTYEYRYCMKPFKIVSIIENGFKYSLKNTKEDFEVSFKDIIKQTYSRESNYIYSNFVEPFIPCDSEM